MLTLALALRQNNGFGIWSCLVRYSVDLLVEYHTLNFFKNNHFSLKAHPTQTFTPAAQVQSICICFAAEVNPAVCSSLWNDYYVQQQLHPVGFYENVCSAGF